MFKFIKNLYFKIRYIKFIKKNKKNFNKYVY